MTLITIAKYFHWGPSVTVTVELISPKCAAGDVILWANLATLEIEIYTKTTLDNVLVCYEAVF